MEIDPRGRPKSLANRNSGKLIQWRVARNWLGRASASHIVTMNRSLIEPFLTFSSRRDLREAAFKAWQQRGGKPGATDNRALIGEILVLRQERAKLAALSVHVPKALLYPA